MTTPIAVIRRHHEVRFCERLADRLTLVIVRIRRASSDYGGVKTLVVVHKRRAQRKVVTHCCKDGMRGIKAI